MNYIVSRKPEKEASGALTELLEKHKENPILLLLSGGSAFSLLKHVDTSFLGIHVTLGVLDERYSKDPAVNNFAQLTNLPFYKTATLRGAKTIDTRVKDDMSRNELAEGWETQLRTWKKENETGAVIATMGIGEDGHTAGIMPNISEPDMHGAQWIVSYHVPEHVNEQTERITVTFTFLQEIVDEAVTFVSGENKKEALSKLMRKDETLEEAPSRIMHEMRSVNLYTDIVL